MGAINFSIDPNLLRLFCRELPLEIFFETGTFRGETLRLAHPLFKECNSVELSPEHHAAAEKEFAGVKHVRLHRGESPACLAAHRERLAATPTLFWLDAHWCSADNTAGAESQSPLLGELKAIGRLHPKSVVLIDDARLYLCPPPAPHRASDWPDFHEIVQALLALSANHRLMVCNDVLLFYPAAMQPALKAFARDHGADWLHLASLARKYEERRRRRRKITRWLNPFQKP